MRWFVIVLLFTAAFFHLPESAHAQIAMRRGTIVSVGVFEDDRHRVVFGNIVVQTGSLKDQKPGLTRAKITNQTVLTGGPDRRPLKFGDLKPGMEVEIVVVGQRGSPDPEWEARSIRLIAPAAIGAAPNGSSSHRFHCPVPPFLCSLSEIKSPLGCP